MKVRALPGQSLRHGAPTVRRLAARPPRAQPGVSGSDAGGPVPPLEALPLPEGSLGLPLVGETLELLKDGNSFGMERTRLYGPLWKTNILGAPTVMVYADADVRAVLAMDGRQVESWWPGGTNELVGPESLNVLPQPRQAQAKAPFLRALGEKAVAARAPLLARVVDSVLGVWADAGVGGEGGGGKSGAGAAGGRGRGELAALAAARRALPLCDALASATFNAILFGIPGGAAAGAAGGAAAAAAAAEEDGAFLSEALSRARLAAALAGGFVPPMLDLPFTAFGRAARARRELLAIYSSELSAARARLSGGASSIDAGGGEPAPAVDALAAAGAAAGLSDGEILDGIVACLFGNAGAGPTMVKAFQYLHPWAERDGGGGSASGGGGWWRRLREEQARLVAERGAALDAAALERMPVAEAVARELLRITPVVPAIFRIATEDFELSGRRIPKGWRVWCHTGSGVLKYNRDAFDPSRWMTNADISGDGGGGGAGGGCPMAAAAAAAAAAGVDDRGGSPFGQGARACVGRPLMMAQLKALLALLARRYTWRFESGAAGPDEPWAIVPAPRPRDGLAGFVLARAGEGEALPVHF